MTNELNPDIKWELEGVKLALPSYQINDKEFLEMTKRHKEHPLNTYLDQVLVNYLSISGKQKSEIFTDISPGLNPTKLYMLFQETSRFNGDYSLNPYKVRQIRSKKIVYVHFSIGLLPPPRSKSKAAARRFDENEPVQFVTVTRP